LACEVTLQPLRRFDLDAAIIFSDILVVPQALGMTVEMVPGKGPSFPEPLVTPEDFKRLNMLPEDIKLKESLGYVLEAITLTRHSLQGAVPLIGFSGAPWTLFAYMIQGGGAKTFHKSKAWLYTYPEESHVLLKLLAETVADYLILQVQAGAQALEVFDSWAGDLSSNCFKTFCLPYLKLIAAKVKKACPTIPVTVFAKGVCENLSLLKTETVYDVVSVDWVISPQYARSQTSADVDSKTPDRKLAVQGNLDMSVLYASDETIVQEVNTMLSEFNASEGSYIANLGHGMLPSHSPDKLAVFIDTVHKFKANNQ
jgi:uroporphyrinogen decarboxylase